jgi:hypothetical protein
VNSVQRTSTRRRAAITRDSGGRNTESKIMNAHNTCFCLPSISGDKLDEDDEGRRGVSARTHSGGIPKRRASDLRTGCGRARCGEIRTSGDKSNALMRLAASVCKGNGMRHRLGAVILALAVGTSRDM